MSPMPPILGASPPRSGSLTHSRNVSLSEAVLGPQAVIVDEVPSGVCNGNANETAEEVSVDYAEHHEALIGRQRRVEAGRSRPVR